MEKAKIFVFDVHHHPRNDYCVSVYYKEGEKPLCEDNLEFSPYTVSFYIVPEGQGMTKMLSDTSHDADYTLPFTIFIPERKDQAAMDFIVEAIRERDGAAENPNKRMFGLSAAHCVVNMSEQEKDECRKLGASGKYEKFEDMHQNLTHAQKSEVIDHKKGAVFRRSRSPLVTYRLGYTPKTPRDQQDEKFLLRDVAMFELDDEEVKNLEKKLAETNHGSGRLQRYFCSAMYKRPDVISNRVRGIIHIGHDVEHRHLQKIFLSGQHPIKIVIGQTTGHITELFPRRLRRQTARENLTPNESKLLQGPHSDPYGYKRCYQQGCYLKIETDKRYLFS